MVMLIGRECFDCKKVGFLILQSNKLWRVHSNSA